MLVPVPFMRASVAKDDFAACGRVEMAMVVVERPPSLGRHLRLAALVCSQSTQSKAYSEAGEAKRTERQPVNASGSIRSRRL